MTDTNPNPFIKSLRDSSGLRLAVLFGSFFVFLCVASILSVLIDGIPGSEKSHLLLNSFIQCLLVFCLPAYLLSKFSSSNWEEWLKLKKAPSVKSLAGVVILYVISLPAMEWLVEWNSHLALPESLSGLDKMLREWEESAASTTNIILQSESLFSMISSVLIVGVLTGFSEELFFRGGVQGVFCQSGMKKSMAVWLAAFIFSAMHFQFFGFIPRLLMGACFGYLLLWTGSIWVPIFAHVLNNSIVVISAYITGNSEANNPVLNTGSMVFVIGSLILTVIFLSLGRNIFFTNNITETAEKWQKNQLPPVSEK